MKSMNWVPLSLTLLLPFSPPVAADESADVAERFSYAMGVQLGRMLQQQGIEGIDPDAFARAIGDVIENRPLQLTDADMRQAVADRQQMLEARQAQIAEGNTAAGSAFLAENAQKPGVETLPSGVQYRVLEAGEGRQPGENAQVRVHYHGTKIDGTVFDSSVDRGEPATFPVGGVIPGFREALSSMREGAHWQVFIPGDQAYGERGAGGKIGPNETLIFDLQLLEIVD
jgi:FKBP-type peptidyl-prolyl cis-trans isomerase FklB